MRLKQPLKRRISIAFFLMTLIVGGISSISIFFIVQTLEEYFVSQELSDELHDILQNNMSYEYILKLRKDTRFYTSTSEQYAIPEDFKHVKKGFSEILLNNGTAFYVFKQTINNQKYLVVQDQTDFETREQLLLCVVFGGFILSLIISWILGLIIANRVIAPVIKLAKQVEHLEKTDYPRTPLSSQYADDEVGQLAKAFDNSLQALHNALDRERLFTSDVSHELRTPLMVIASSCELLLETPNTPPKTKEQISRISRANKTMNDLVQTFLMLARSKTLLTIGGVGTLSDIAKEQINHWQNNFIEKNITLTLIEQETSEQTYNIILLKTVISNLLNNALHYTEQGEVKLVLQSHGFYVEDTGIGIPKEQQQLIFQTFARIDPNRGEGLGLGLSLVKRICTHQSWQVSVTSNSKDGSTFHVTLQP